MPTMVCSKCGTSLAPGAKACPSCGQAVTAVTKPATPPGPVVAKRSPMMALAVVIGGLAVILAAVTLYRSGAVSAPGAPPAATPTAAVQPTPASGTTANPPVAGAPGTQTPQAPPVVGASMPNRPAVTSTVAITPPALAKPAPPPPPPFEKTYECREAADFNVNPDTAILTVDGEVIGIADEWSNGVRSKKYDFKGEGVHYVKVSHLEYKTVWLRFIVTPKAEHKTAHVEMELKEQK